MRIKYHKEIEFFLKNNFLTERYFLKKRLERSIKNNDEQEIKLVKNLHSVCCYEVHACNKQN